ncbi:MAG: serine--tRNA ligase, partial [Candidatus Aminicenantaceae bacterium]
MLDPKFILENPDLVIEKTAARGMKLDLTEFLDLSAQRKTVLQEVEKLRAELNRTSKLIGTMKKEGQDATEAIKEMKQVSDAIKAQDEELREADEKLRSVLLNIPNLAHETVPAGLSEKDNQEIRTFGRKPEFNYPARPHWEIGSNLGILDFERASKITGTRFAVYLGAGALMERALINFMLDLHTRKHHYLEVLPPFIVNRESMTGTGQL